jgi:acetyl-CoA C-acetyltransferase
MHLVGAVHLSVAPLSLGPRHAEAASRDEIGAQFLPERLCSMFSPEYMARSPSSPLGRRRACGRGDRRRYGGTSATPVPPEYIGWMVAVKDRLNALKNPYAHLKLPDITIEKVKESEMLWDPIRFLESCPSSDGAAAAVLVTEKEAMRSPRKPAWVTATAVRSELSQFPGRDAIKPAAGVECARDVYRQAGITNPRQEIDVAELYVPFSWYEPMWLEGHEIAEPGKGWTMVDQGDTELTGSFPVNPSGGVLSSNPIGASGMLRFIEAANQVREEAGEHQVDGVRTALAQAYGGAAQYFAICILRSSKP